MLATHRLEQYLIWLVDLICFWNCKAVILVKHDCFDIDLTTLPLEGRVQRDWQVLEG